MVGVWQGPQSLTDLGGFMPPNVQGLGAMLNVKMLVFGWLVWWQFDLKEGNGDRESCH